MLVLDLTNYFVLLFSSSLKHSGLNSLVFCTISVVTKFRFTQKFHSQYCLLYAIITTMVDEGVLDVVDGQMIEEVWAFFLDLDILQGREVMAMAQDSQMVARMNDLFLNLSFQGVKKLCLEKLLLFKR